MDTTEINSETIKKARQFGYATVIRGTLPSSKNPQLKAAADANLDDAAKGLVAKYGERLSKQASRREMVYRELVAPVAAA